MTGPNLTKETLHTLDTETFTRRKVLSPMGLISTFLVIFKIMMRETTALRMLVEQDEVVFDRGTRPSNAL